MAHTCTPISNLYRGERHMMEEHSHTRSIPPKRRGDGDIPWKQTRELNKSGRLPIKTAEWVKEQQTILKTETFYHMSKTRTISNARKQEWEELIYAYEVEADMWMRHEERTRRVAQERERTRLRIQEELRRIEAKYHQKREAERAGEEARRREQSETRDKDRRDRGKLMADAWANYESRWSSLQTTTKKLDFQSVPWPLTVPPKSTEDITQEAIAAFLFSQYHSPAQSRKERIRNAQLRWHPDRFRRFLGRVSEADRAIVEAGVGIVARVLNDLTEKEKRKSN